MRRFHEQSDASGLNSDWLPRIRRVLTALSQASGTHDLEIPGLHPLKGDRRGEWAATVSGNWRIVFRFDDGQAVDVNLEDYH